MSRPALVPGAQASVVVPPTAYGMSCSARREQNDPDDHENDADRPQNRDSSQETDDQQNNSKIRSPLRSTYPLVTALKQGGWTARRYGHSSLDCFRVMAQGVLVCRLIVVGRQWFATSHNTHSKIKTSTKTTKKVIRAKGGRRVGASGGKSSPYEAWTVEELTHRAKELDLQCDSNLEKSELIDALRNH